MANFPRLIADVGGTNARFSLELEPQNLTQIMVFSCKDFLTLYDAIKHYMETCGALLGGKNIQHFAIAIANPVIGDHIKMTNHDWEFSISEMKRQLNAETLLLINDFSAQALAITVLGEEYFTKIAGDAAYSEKEKHLPIAVVGPGTGLGVSGLIPDGKGNMIALAGEGGHVAFSPYDEKERHLLAFAESIFKGHVSVERLLQGEGLVLIYQFFVTELGEISLLDKELTTLQPSDITDAALVAKDSLCIKVLQQYCSILGGMCADIALVVGGTGGVYVCGGIVPRFINFLRQSDFHKRFLAKGRFSDYLKPIPIYVVEHPYPGLIGASVALNQHLS